MAFVFRSPAFFVLLFIGVINAGVSAWFVGDFYGSDSYPVTRLMVQALQGGFTIMPIIIANKTATSTRSASGTIASALNTAMEIAFVGPLISCFEESKSAPTAVITMAV